MTTCAIYARKSSDDSDRDQETRSTQRQVEHATAFAQAKGWTVDPLFIFVDEAVSGAEWKHRPGWNKLVATLDPKPPFGVVVVSEISRVGRDSVRTPAAILALEEAGVEVWSYLNGRISLSDESGEMSTMLQSLLASFERRRASDRTKDALRRRFEAGAATGGAPYGYSVHRNGGPYAELVVNPVEAATVRQIFRWFDEGHGVRNITKRLNADGIPAPRGGTKGGPLPASA
jgi:site-specific DNA recombinase